MIREKKDNKIKIKTVAFQLGLANLTEKEQLCFEFHSIDVEVLGDYHV